jgi:hypothetical protein
MTFCVQPLTSDEILELVGDTFVSKFQHEMDLVLAPLRKHIALGRPLSLGKELWEYAVADSIDDGEWNGAGKSVIDVKIGEHIGIDVKSVSRGIKNKTTSEASIFQNFNQDAKTYFTSQDAQGVWNIHIEGWRAKIQDIGAYYLLCIIREKETLNCTLAGFRISKHPISFNPDLVKFNRASIHFNGLVDKQFANIRYYNSKSRLEITFNRKCWTDRNHFIDLYKYENEF